MYPRLAVAWGVFTLVLLFAVYALFKYGSHEAQKAAKLEQQVVVLQGARTELQQRLRGVQGELERQRTENKEVQNALKQNPTWRDGAVPPSVSAGLCNRVQCD